MGQCARPTTGEWVDAADVDAVGMAVAKYSEDGAIEVFAADAKGFGSIRAGSIEEMQALAEYLEGSDDAGARLAYAEYTNTTDPADLEREFEDALNGEWQSEEEFAEDLIRQCHNIPAALDFYIDWQKWAHDLFISDYFSVPAPRGVYVFRNC